MDGALAAQIQAGRRLKKVETNDRSAPLVADSPSGGASRPGAGFASAPKPPGFKLNSGAPKPPTNNQQNAGPTHMPSGPPQLGGLFAGGMPTLRKTNGPSSSATSFKSAPPVPKPPNTSPPSRAPPPAPSLLNHASPSRPPPPVPPQPPSLVRPPPPPPPPVPAQSFNAKVSSPLTRNAAATPHEIPSPSNLRPTKSLASLPPQELKQPPPPPNRPPTQISPSNPLARTPSVGHQPRLPPSRIASANPPPPPPPRPSSTNPHQPPPLPSRPGARAAPPPPPPRNQTHSPNLSGSLSRKAPPPPPRPSGLLASTKTAPSAVPSVESITSNPSWRPSPPPAPAPAPPPVSSNPSYPSPPARLPPPPARLPPPVQPFAVSLPSSVNPAPPPPLRAAPPGHPTRASMSLGARNRVMSNPSVPEGLGAPGPRLNGNPKLRPKSMVVSGTLASLSTHNRPPSPPTSYSAQPPRNFPSSNLFPPPRPFQSGLAHQYPSSKARGCDWDFKAVLA